MSNLCDKKILLGITGSIAAYKSVELIRLLRLRGAQVKVVMTRDALEFITELTIQAVSGERVHLNLLDKDAEASMSHISLAKWADVIIVAPATANVMAKFASGLADDLLSTLYLATNAPVIIAPAMNQQMWQHPATIKNKITLTTDGVTFIGPGFGSQACGDVGPGRMLEPTEIIQHLENFFSPKLLSGTNILLTAGPTREPIDPVRYISNHSSGKMGLALAQAAISLGANVTIIAGPTAITWPSNALVINVETAAQMHQAVLNNISASNIFIACAAVADYRPSTVSHQKIKKPFLPTISLSPNDDILTSVTKLPKPPFVVGFAAESENLIENATKKLIEKKLDLIIANLITDPETGFNSDHNAVTVIDKNTTTNFPLMTKQALATELLPFIYHRYITSPLVGEVDARSAAGEGKIVT